MKKVENFELPNGHEPFDEWLEQLELRVQARIQAYIDRVAKGGSKKNVRVLGDGVFEIKLDFGPGYRVYFGELGSDMILLIIGGDKGSQEKNIETAKMYWRTYVQK